MSLRERKKQQTTDRIVQAATKLFRTQGYEATRTKQIADAAGIATGTLFNYAPTKHDVVVLIWRERVTELAERALAAGSLRTQPGDIVEAVFRPIFEFYVEDRALGRLFLQAVMYQNSQDPRMQALNELFVARLGLLFAGHTDDPYTTGINVFAAYYAVLTMLLAERLPDPEAAVSMLRALVGAQRRGWRSSASARPDVER